MSEPKRYTLRMPDISYGMREGLYGEYVRYDDYARLKAEVAKWQRCESVACDKMLELCGEIKVLKAEVERLTKAGWQPMETAPFNRNIKIIVDRNDEGEVGIIWSSDVQHYSVEQYPDWWMPLPSAPANERKSQP